MPMVLELTIISPGQDRSMSSAISKLVKIIEGSGLDYQMAAFDTLVEGTWDKLMGSGKQCHFAVRKETTRVLYLLKLDDYGERTR